MQEPSEPDNEAQRMACLIGLGILDTPPEERFDRITRMAKRLFNTPIAVVSLVDENRQWFKSVDGLDATETGRNVSFCGHAILDDDVMVVNDATKDKRFEGNPLVDSDPNIRFYAGKPLKDKSGVNLGTLCIIDSVPREFCEEDRALLEDLAQMVEQELSSVQASITDELTAISNRRGFNVLAKYSMDFCRRRDIPVSLLFFDLDKFKYINDEFGHLEGDRALCLFAEALRHCFRSSDVIARLGGDEFVVLMADVDEAIIDEKIRDLTSTLARLRKDSNLPCQVSFSYGFVRCADQNKSIDSLIVEADEKMYAAKKCDKN